MQNTNNSVSKHTAPFDVIPAAQRTEQPADSSRDSTITAVPLAAGTSLSVTTLLARETATERPTVARIHAEIEIGEQPNEPTVETCAFDEQGLRDRSNVELRLIAEEEQEKREPNDRKGKRKVENADKEAYQDPAGVRPGSSWNTPPAPFTSSTWSEEEFTRQSHEHFFVLLTYLFDPKIDLQSVKTSYVWKQLEDGLSSLDPTFLNSPLGENLRQFYFDFVPGAIALFLKNSNRGEFRRERLLAFLEWLEADESLAARFTSKAIKSALQPEPRLAEKPLVESREDFATGMLSAHMHDMDIILKTLATSTGKAFIKSDVDYQTRRALAGFSITEAIHTVLTQDAIRFPDRNSKKVEKEGEGTNPRMLKEFCQMKVASEIACLLKVLIKVYCQIGRCIEAETKQPLPFQVYYSAVGASITKILEGIVNEESVFDYILLLTSTEIASLSTLLSQEEKQYLVCRLSDLTTTPGLNECPKFVSNAERHQRLLAMLHATLLLRTLTAQEIDLASCSIRQLRELCRQAIRYVRSGGTQNFQENISRALEVHEELCLRMIRRKDMPGLTGTINVLTTFIGECLGAESIDHDRLKQSLINIVQALATLSKSELQQIGLLTSTSVIAIHGALDAITKTNKKAIPKSRAIEKWIVARMVTYKNDFELTKDTLLGRIGDLRQDTCQSWAYSTQCLSNLYDIWRNSRERLKHYSHALRIQALFEVKAKDYKKYGVLAWNESAEEIKKVLSQVTEELKAKIPGYNGIFNEMLKMKFAAGVAKEHAEYFSAASIEQEVKEICSDLNKPNKLFDALKLSTSLIRDNIEFQLTMMRAEFVTKECLARITNCLADEQSSNSLGGDINKFFTAMLQLLPKNSMFQSTAHRLLRTGEIRLIKQVVIELLKLPPEKIEKAIESFSLVTLVACKQMLDEMIAQRRDPFLFVESGRKLLASTLHLLDSHLANRLPMFSEAVENFASSIEQLNLSSSELVREQISSNVLECYQTVLSKIESLELDSVFKVGTLMGLDKEIEHSIFTQFNKFAVAYESLLKIMSVHFSQQDAALLQRFQWVERTL